MNEEIKEILVSLNSQCKSAKGCINSYFRVEYIQKLLNYITNLQQEIEKLNDDKRGMLVQLHKANDERDKLKQENERLKDNQLKALNMLIVVYGGNDEYYVKTILKARNILQNGSDS